MWCAHYDGLFLFESLLLLLIVVGQKPSVSYMTALPQSKGFADGETTHLVMMEKPQ